MSNNQTPNFDPQAYWEKRLKSNTGLTGVGYTLVGEHYNKWAYKIRKYVFNKIVTKNLKDQKNADILDIGSGSGFYIDEWLTYQPKSMTGIDITEIAVSRLSEKYTDLTFHKLDISDLAATQLMFQQKFHAISCMDVLFHIVDDEKYKSTFQSVAQLLVNGGYFIFSENFVHEQLSTLKHHKSRSKVEIEQLLAQNNFKIISRRPFMYLMNEPVDSNSFILKWLWKITAIICAKSALLGYIIGAITFPIEKLLVSLLKESPTSEIVIAVKLK
ncbi:MAG TPA: class I SAM-dependent methyltransferase [Chitinophagales bacterium]|nr:class I SAM-dependent methyltransferase [Chitinophagales bacterium]HRG27272.1 class I SAM-dependent methyltransferase [Chitinophagales bacterium]HRG86545.1 class I SAM-dependent methyltransferase [Chitinophagales bacterium]HRH53747.1 class I SAM-dependent methyltransferase [Chitinophagales bacterium]